MKFGIIVFPGSNCDRDTREVLERVLGIPAEFIWYRETHTNEFSALIIPGGFSYGDYLRTGAIAATSPVMREVRREAEKGKPVLGICNGFQILLESALLPGALLTNRDFKFICRDVFLRPERRDTAFTRALPQERAVLRMPIAHHTGNYFADDATLEQLEAEGRILFRYCDESGAVTGEANPNGSRNNIAGVLNAGGNVLGMMPHPERAAESILGSDDGSLIFRSLREYLL